MISRDLDRLVAAIVESQGNLTRTSKLLGVSKQHVMALARKQGLNDWARQIRIENGIPPVGNPQWGRPPRL